MDPVSQGAFGAIFAQTISNKKKILVGSIIGCLAGLAPDLDILISRIRHHDLPIEPFRWYLDLRKYGSVPHSGFGLGLERTVAWICGTKHIRETIPFPRTMSRLEP